MAGKYEKLESYDQKFKELSRRMEPGNLGNTNPGKRGSNLVSGFASMFEKVSGACKLFVKDDRVGTSSTHLFWLLLSIGVVLSKRRQLPCLH